MATEHEGTCDVCHALHWRTDLRHGQCQACRDMGKAIKDPKRRQTPWLPLSQRQLKT